MGQNACLKDGRLIRDGVGILVRVVAVEMGDPVVCTLVLVRDSLFLFLLSLLFGVNSGICYRRRTSGSVNPVRIVNIFNRSSVADPS